MSIKILKAPNITDLMRSEEGNDSLDTFIRQAIGKEPFISFSRAGDSPVQWIQLLHALDQQELPGWPLLTPLKIQMQKCDKCSLEFYSSINYRRHIRVHHRLKRLDKDSAKNRDLLRVFWDKLFLDEAKEIVCFKNVSLEEVPGYFIIKSLTTLMKKPGFSSLPQVCLKAGTALLDIIQARPSRFPLTSLELFSILDDASENTFLRGTAVSMQRYIFDREAGKIVLEPKNLVACTSFLVEQNLVRAWLADKDAEALRCQKLLVEEEEAAQKRQTELLERRRQKKLRQKEQNAKEQKLESGDEEIIDDTHKAGPLGETGFPLVASDSDTQNPDSLPYGIPSTPEPSPNTNTHEDIEHETVGFDIIVTGQNVERRTRQVSGPSHRVFSRWQVPQKSQQSCVPIGFLGHQNSHTQKLGAMQKHGTQRDSSAAPIFSGNKVWSRKPKPENEGGTLNRIQKEVTNRSDQNRNHEVLIGSISVTLGNCSHNEGNSAAGVLDCLTDDQMQKKSNVQEKPAKPESAQGTTNRPVVKFWRPVSRNGTRGANLLENLEIESEADTLDEKVESQSLSAVECLRSSAMDASDVEIGNDSASALQGGGLFSGSLKFSSQDAKDFLAKRWKEAIIAEHVKLVRHPDFGPSGCPEVQNYCEVAMSQTSDIH